MKKWLLMAILCLSMAGCEWLKGDSESDETGATDTSANGDGANDGDTTDDEKTKPEDDSEGAS